MAKVIALASPVFLLLIGLEWWWAQHLAGTPDRPANNHAGRPALGYRFHDTLNSLSLGMMSQMVNLLTKGVLVFFYALAYEHVAIWPHLALWHTAAGMLLALLLYDFCYYWLHRMGHEVNVLWAAHVVHHQSQHYNLSTALRQTSSGFLLGWIFYLPMALVGVPPEVFGVVALIDLLYQFWVHTEFVGKLGWFDRWFCSPSNHRVHHAVNDAYLDKNYGGILIVWDRIFGSFQEEEERCIYGTRSALNSWDPIWANLEVYASLWRDCLAAPRWRDKLRVWLKHPGWRPAGLDAIDPKPPFRLDQVFTYDVSSSPGKRLFNGALFVSLLGAVVAVLELAATRPPDLTAASAVGVAVALWALGAHVQTHLSGRMTLLVLLAVLATLSSVLNWTVWHFGFKPLVMIFAIFYVANFSYGASGKNHFSLKSSSLTLLMAALAMSGVGDVLLMLPGNLFIPGLASFLVAHLFYLALFRSDMKAAPWFPSKPALAGTLLAALAMYALVWPGLRDPVLQLAVAAYALVIALMAAQALGRATVQKTAASRLVAAGACWFMLSDSLIAINRFVQPIPLSAFWILGTYYLAQLLMVGNALRVRRTDSPGSV
ncbi:MAG: hypothetical protein RLZZ126_151 [Pseudomonadota bacterium]|jgi:sterol desaturase/sphingolipid hydroxylase (fatty acid hydroxylase superfamily)/uncharacterized membrane protein YhhN